MRVRFIAVALLLTAASPQRSVAQVTADNLGATLRDLRAAAEPSLRSGGPLDATWSRIGKAVEWLNGRAASTDPAGVSIEYLRSLQRATELLKQVRSSRSLDRTVLEDVADELEAKVEHCRLLGVGMGGSVLLKINTRTASGPASNWQVVYLLKIYERVAGVTPNNFPRLSTPTETTVEPGRYVVWARDPATGKTSERALVRVVGQKELLVDLPVP